MSLPASRPLSICVYCGSRDGAAPAYAEAARECGAIIGQRGWSLVYGGGNCGLMGKVADAALDHGAPVVGVIPERLLDREIVHPRVTDTRVVQNMHERKKLMADQADAFVALPGGIGTLEELFETWTWRQLGYHHKPVGLLNVNGYFDRLIDFIHKSQEDNFLWPDVQDMLLIDTDAGRLLDRLAQQVRPQAPTHLDET